MSPFAVIHVQVCNFCQHQWLTLFSSVCDISCPHHPVEIKVVSLLLVNVMQGLNHQ